MTESLSVFADEVTRVAREVGTEDWLGGQGLWKLFSRAYGNMKAYQAQAAASANHSSPNGHNSAPPTAHAHCPTCGRSISDPLLLTGYSDLSPDSGPLIVPMGPLAAAAFESGMSAVEELKLLKAQIQDVAHVCNAVARGDQSYGPRSGCGHGSTQGRHQYYGILLPFSSFIFSPEKQNLQVDKLGQFAKEVTSCISRSQN